MTTIKHIALAAVAATTLATAVIGCGGSNKEQKTETTTPAAQDQPDMTPVKHPPPAQ